MTKPPLPFDEKQRHQELLNFQILDTDEEAAYNAFADLAAIICHTKSAAISFVDRDRQWFKASKNIHFKEGHRDNSFCGHAILQDEIMIINDPLKDERFFDNPEVTGGLNIRFYAGYPIVTSTGQKIGTVCVLHDQQGHNINDSQIRGLKIIADQISTLLNIRLQNIETARQSLTLINAEKNLAKLNVFRNEHEKSEIAYTLHENIAQITAAAKMKIEAHQNNPTFSMKDIINIKDYLTTILSEVLKLSNSVTPTTFESADYLDYIYRMIDNFKKTYNTKITFGVEGNAAPLKSTVGLAFYRIIQYQLYYAQLTESTEVSISISNKENIVLLFEYNGNNKNLESIEADLYLNNINTHADVINASFTNDFNNKRMEIVYQSDQKALTNT